MNKAQIQIDAVRKTYQMAMKLFTRCGIFLFASSKTSTWRSWGPSGSGKSTLLNILGCLDTPSAGQYVLDGEAISEMKGDALAGVRNRKIGFVFQTFNLLSRATALQNVELPLILHGPIQTPSQRTGQSHAGSRGGYPTAMTHRPNELSEGTASARRYRAGTGERAAILLADEPTGNLDTRTGEEILTIFEALHQQGQTVLVVTHERRRGPAHLARCAPARRLHRTGRAAISAKIWRRCNEQNQILRALLYSHFSLLGIALEQNVHLRNLLILLALEKKQRIHNQMTPPVL